MSHDLLRPVADARRSRALSRSASTRAAMVTDFEHNITRGQTFTMFIMCSAPGTQSAQILEMRLRGGALGEVGRSPFADEVGGGHSPRTCHTPARLIKLRICAIL